MNPLSSRKAGPTDVGPTELLMHTGFTMTPPSSLAIPTSRQTKKKPTTTTSESSSKSPPGSSKVQHVPCKFFRNGACTAGKNCVFSHIKENAPSAIVCKYYVKGNCKFGNKCALQHGNEKKPSRSNPKPKATPQFSNDRLRQEFDQRTLLEFGEEVEMLSRSLSRNNLDLDYNNMGLPNANGLNFYTPQPKTSQLSTMFSSPNQSQFFMKLPSQHANPEEMFSSLNPFGSKQGAPIFPERLRGNDFPSPNFNFGFSDEHDLLPSSLDELLTPTELQMRKSKASMLSRPGFMSRTSTPGPEFNNTTSPLPKFLNRFETGIASSSLPTLSSLGLSDRCDFTDLNSHAAPHNSFMTHSFNSESLFSVDTAEEGKDDSGSSQTSDTKKDDHSISHGLDDEIPFPMEGGF